MIMGSGHWENTAVMQPAYSPTCSPRLDDDTYSFVLLLMDERIAAV